MNWVNLAQEWGYPVVTIAIARRFLPQIAVLEVLQALDETDASRVRVQQWVEHLFAGKYVGVFVSGVHMVPEKDALLLSLVHPAFPCVRPYAAVPCWELTIHEADTPRPRITIEERGA